MKMEKHKDFTKQIHWVKHSIKWSRQCWYRSPCVLGSKYPMSMFLIKTLLCPFSLLLLSLSSSLFTSTLDSSLNPVASNVLHKDIALPFLILARSWWFIVHVYKDDHWSSWWWKLGHWTAKIWTWNMKHDQQKQHDHPKQRGHPKHNQPNITN